MNETDLTLSYSLPVGPEPPTAGVIHYDFDGSDTQEIYLTCALATILNPSLSLYYDIDEGEAGFAVLAVSQAFPVGPDSLTAGGSLGFNLGDKAVNSQRRTATTSPASTMVKCTSRPASRSAAAWSIDPRIAYSSALGDDGEDAITAISVPTAKRTCSTAASHFQSCRFETRIAVAFDLWSYDHGGEEGLFKVLNAVGSIVRQVPILGCGLDRLHRVKIRRIGWQELGDNPPPSFEPVLDGLCPVWLAAVPDERESLRQMPPQPLKEMENLSAPDVVSVLSRIQAIASSVRSNRDCTDGRESIAAIPSPEGSASGPAVPRSVGLRVGA